MDKDRNSKKIVFMRKARDFFDKQVEKEEEKLERELTNKERRETRKKNRKKARVAAIVASFALGVAGGAVGSHLLDSGHNIEVVEKKEHSVEIDDKEVDGVISIKNSKHAFINGIHIGKDELEVAKNMNGNLEINTRREVDMLKDKPEQVLTYIKTVFANEFNQKEGTNITCNDITIHREKRQGIDDPREKVNMADVKRILGDNALEPNPEDPHDIFKEDGTVKEGNTMEITITIDNKDCHHKIKLPYTCYEQDGSIKDKYTPGAVEIVNSLPVIDKGLDWIDEEARDNGSKQIFFESILENKISQMNEIATRYMEIDEEEEQGYFVDTER